MGRSAYAIRAVRGGPIVLRFRRKRGLFDRCSYVQLPPACARGTPRPRYETVLAWLQIAAGPFWADRDRFADRWRAALHLGSARLLRGAGRSRARARAVTRGAKTEVDRAGFARDSTHQRRSCVWRRAVPDRERPARLRAAHRAVARGHDRVRGGAPAVQARGPFPRITPCISERAENLAARLKRVFDRRLRFGESRTCADVVSFQLGYRCV